MSGERFECANAQALFRTLQEFMEGFQRLVVEKVGKCAGYAVAEVNALRWIAQNRYQSRNRGFAQLDQAVRTQAVKSFVADGIQDGRNSPQVFGFHQCLGGEVPHVGSRVPEGRGEHLAGGGIVDPGKKCDGSDSFGSVDAVQLLRCLLNEGGSVARYENGEGPFQFSDGLERLGQRIPGTKHVVREVEGLQTLEARVKAVGLSLQQQR